ncbi:hypothetical protein ACH42_12720 [Endozoicomonas sp. (ex Bugula neritina AB1)]|nr:hypothetical protein ACH42_12720 [Endozoicomonas sp. (ex Bugula neritina AB1)]
MTDLLALSLFLAASAVIIYHHVGYPVVSKLLALSNTDDLPSFYHRHYRVTPLDHMLPRICLVMPGYNEEACIQEKIRNLACIDYPEDKLHIVIYCDGCTDDTALLARRTLQEPECQHLQSTVVEKTINCGKVAVLNKAISLCHCDVIALSDVSALLSIDCLLITAAQLSNDKTGVVCGSYHFLHSLSVGEQAYWYYQRKIKAQESAAGATLGVHGAFYAFRKELFEKLPSDTINDDFTLPISIVMKGYQCLYDPRITTLELEQACIDMDFRRRQRIACGNVQQAIRHIGLLHPRFGKIALNFLSGKFLRPFISIFLLVVLLTSVELARTFALFQIILVAQLIAYGMTFYYLTASRQPTQKPLKIFYYILSGHVAMAFGLIRYITGYKAGEWGKIKQKQQGSHRTKGVPR